MKVTKYQNTYRLTINQREAELLLTALYNSSSEDLDSGDDQTVQEGIEKNDLWHKLVRYAGTN